MSVYFIVQTPNAAPIEYTVGVGGTSNNTTGLSPWKHQGLQLTCRHERAVFRRMRLAVRPEKEDVFTGRRVGGAAAPDHTGGAAGRLVGRGPTSQG